MIFTMYLASSGVAARASRVQAVFAAGRGLQSRGTRRRHFTLKHCRALPGLDGRGRPSHMGSRVGRWENRSGDRSQVSEFSVRRVRSASVFSSEFGDGSPQHSCRRFAEWSLPRREMAAGEKYRRDGRLLRRARFQIFGDDGGLFEFLGRAGNPLAGLARLMHAISVDSHVARASRSCVPSQGYHLSRKPLIDASARARDARTLH